MNGEKNEIDRMHVWTHKQEIEKIIKNEKMRMVIRELADAIQYSANCYSSIQNDRILPYDRHEIKDRLHYCIILLGEDKEGE